MPSESTRKTIAPAVHTPEQKLSALVEDMARPREDGESLQAIEKLYKVQELAKLGGLPSYEPLLPMLLTLNGKPYTLNNHFPVSPVFRLMQPDKLQLKAARQVAKSQSMAATSVLFGASQPHYKILHVTPLFEQIRRFSSNYIRPLIDGSPVKDILVDALTTKSVLQRSFRNGAALFFSFASNNADRIRGLSVHRNCIDELQDFDIDDLPIINETMSAAVDFDSSVIYGGTPKTLDNPVEKVWRDSSQAEWVIKCPHCSYWNMCSINADLEKMIGPYHDFISEKQPGTVCARCQKPVNPRHGRWLHAYPHKKFSFAGYHIPQVIMPMHYAKPQKWAFLLRKQAGGGNMTRAQFYNEVLGESLDAGQKLITDTELRRAATLPWTRAPRPDMVLLSRSREYAMRIMAVDWGGAGEQQTSFTTIAVLGFLPSGEIHVIWGKRFLLSQNHVDEAKQVLHYYKAFNCQYITHDYSGAGTMRETFLVGAGIDNAKNLPIEYIRAASGKMMRYIPPTDIHPRRRWRLDKTRSLLTTCNAIRFGKIKFFKYDNIDSDDSGLICDFLALIENKVESRMGSDIYTITRNPALPDDFAQAVNIGACALWQINSAWPDFSNLAVIPTYSSQELADIGDDETDWRNYSH